MLCCSCAESMHVGDSGGYRGQLGGGITGVLIEARDRLDLPASPRNYKVLYT